MRDIENQPLYTGHTVHKMGNSNEDFWSILIRYWCVMDITNLTTGLFPCRSVKPRDEGYYECQISTQLKMSFKVFLRIIGKRRIKFLFDWHKNLDIWRDFFFSLDYLTWISPADCFVCFVSLAKSLRGNLISL